MTVGTSIFYSRTILSRHTGSAITEISLKTTSRVASTSAYLQLLTAYTQKSHFLRAGCPITEIFGAYHRPSKQLGSRSGWRHISGACLFALRKDFNCEKT